MLRAEDFLVDDGDDDALIALQDLELSLRGLSTPADFSSPAAPASPMSNSPESPHASEELRDLTDIAVWTVSTAKPGNGVEQILDGRPDTYWQSDGPQPHSISAHFVYKAKVAEVQVYLDYAADESYTPSSLSVYAGCNVHDLRLIRHLRSVDAPQGWIRIPLGLAPTVMDAFTDEDSSENEGNEDNVEELAAREAQRFRRARRREEKCREKMTQLEEMMKKREKGVNGELEVMRDLTVTKAHMVRVMIHANHQNGRDSHVRMVRALGPKEQVMGSGTRFTSKEFQMYETIR